MAKCLFHVTSFPGPSFQGLRPSPLSPGLVSPEADLCGESSRHHTSLFSFVHMNSRLHRTLTTVAHRLKETQTEAKQGLKCSQMVHCPPGQSLMLHEPFLHIYTVYVYMCGWQRKRVAVCFWGTIKVTKTTSKIGFSPAANSYHGTQHLASCRFYLANLVNLMNSDWQEGCKTIYFPLYT